MRNIQRHREDLEIQSLMQTLKELPDEEKKRIDNDDEEDRDGDEDDDAEKLIQVRQIQDTQLKHQ